MRQDWRTTILTPWRTLSLPLNTDGRDTILWEGFLKTTAIIGDGWFSMEEDILCLVGDPAASPASVS